MYLTPHFTLAELIESDTAIRLGIDNTPPEAILPALRRQAEVLETVRAAMSHEKGVEVPINITSGYRCEALEREIARKDFYGYCASRRVQPDEMEWGNYFMRKSHPKGCATDFKAPAFGAPYHIVKFVSGRPDLMANIDQIIVEGTWVHISTSERPRGDVKTAFFDANGVPHYRFGLI